MLGSNCIQIASNVRRTAYGARQIVLLLYVYSFCIVYSVHNLTSSFRVYSRPVYQVVCCLPLPYRQRRYCCTPPAVMNVCRWVALRMFSEKKKNPAVLVADVRQQYKYQNCPEHGFQKHVWRAAAYIRRVHVKVVVILPITCATNERLYNLKSQLLIFPIVRIHVWGSVLIVQRGCNAVTVARPL